MLVLLWVAPWAGGPTSGRALATAPSGDPASRAVPRRADNVESQPVGGRHNSDKSDGWLRMLGAMAVVTALIFAARWLLRRWGAAGPMAHAGPMEVLARASVAPRQQLLLVRLGKRLVLIGAGGGAMSTLAEVTDPAEVDDLMQAVKSGKDSTLAGLLTRCAGRASPKKTGAGGKDATDKE